MRRRSFQCGDRVRIVNPVFVRRVGYPLVWTDLVDELTSDPRVYQAMHILGLASNPQDILLHHDPRLVRDFVSGVARATVRYRSFGGRERTLHTEERPEWRDQVDYIISKRMARTGKYYGPSGGYDSYNGDYYYEPGGLDHCKTHILLRLGNGLEIESINVERC